MAGLVVYTAAYLAEDIRSGLRSVPEGQWLAARSLGMSGSAALRWVVLPQAVRRVMPPLLNDFIGLQKDSALIAVLGVVEALRQAQIDSSATFNYTPYIATAAEEAANWLAKDANTRPDEHTPADWLKSLNGVVLL